MKNKKKRFLLKLSTIIYEIKLIKITIDKKINFERLFLKER